MKATNLSADRASKASVVQWQWSNGRVCLLGLWAFLLGANLVRVAVALDAREPWWGPGLGAFVSAGSIAWILHTARARRERQI